MAHAAKPIIRWAQPRDASLIIQFVKELASYENEPETSVKITEADIYRDGFSEPKRFECVIAELNGDAVGFALFFYNYSTWEGQPGIHLEDLFVQERARGQGLGKAMLAAIARLAHEQNCKRLDLCVLDWNPTRKFYHPLDIIHMKEWLPYRMNQQALATLANSAPEIIG